MQEYLGDFLPVIAAAALVTLCTTPLFRRLSFRVGAVQAARRAARAHAAHRAARRRRDPRRLPQRDVRRAGAPTTSTTVFIASTVPLGVVLAALVIFAVGQIDDLREVSPPAKAAGTVLAAQHPVDLRREHPLLPHPLRRAWCRCRRTCRRCSPCCGCSA